VPGGCQYVRIVHLTSRWMRMPASSGWYGARLIFEAVLEGVPSAESTYEERIILVSAASESEARRKAEAFARAEEHGYENTEGNHVEWVFREVLDLASLLDEDFRDGAEVFFSFLNARQVAVLREPSFTD
jgi:hypothetical protein